MLLYLENPALYIYVILLDQLDTFTELRYVNVPSKLLFDMTRHRVRRFRLAVRQERRSRCAALHTREPAQHLCPISVRRETANLLLATTDRNPVPENLHLGFAILYASTKRACRLITNEHDRR